MINKQYYQELKELKRKYGILQSPPKSPIKNKQIENINFNDGYINKDDEYYNKYLNTARLRRKADFEVWTYDSDLGLLL